jgi:L-iditol 2-dehydrogenase
MRALRKLNRGHGQTELVSVPTPIPKRGEVIIEVKFAGICGTDIHIYHDLYQNLNPPVTLGHEFSGIVAETGNNTYGWKPGERVTVESAASFCGGCEYCHVGDTQCCGQRNAFGISRDGAFAKFIAVRQEAIHRLPGNLSLEEGALVEPLCVSVHAVLEKSTLTPGQFVLVTGPGTIGLLVAQVAKAVGAHVIVSGMAQDQTRLNLAVQLGVDHIVIRDQEDLLEALGRITKSRGVDAAFECTGAKAAIEDCLKTIRKGGEIIQIGLATKPLELNYDDICLKEIKVKGSFTHNHNTWVKAITLLADRKINLKPLITGKLPLEDWEKAFYLCEKGSGIKYLLYPTA